MLKFSFSRTIKSLFAFTLVCSFFLLSYNFADATVNLDNPLKGVSDIPSLIGKVINAVLGIVGSLALVMFIYGGVIWMTASGNEQSVTKGKNILMWAALGLVVIFSSYALTRFIIQAIGA